MIAFKPLSKSPGAIHQDGGKCEPWFALVRTPGHADYPDAAMTARPPSRCWVAAGIRHTLLGWARGWASGYLLSPNLHPASPPAVLAARHRTGVQTCPRHVSAPIERPITGVSLSEFFAKDNRPTCPEHVSGASWIVELKAQAEFLFWWDTQAEKAEGNRYGRRRPVTALTAGENMGPGANRGRPIKTRNRSVTGSRRLLWKDDGSVIFLFHRTCSSGG